MTTLTYDQIKQHEMFMEHRVNFVLQCLCNVAEKYSDNWEDFHTDIDAVEEYLDGAADLTKLVVEEDYTAIELYYEYLLDTHLSISNTVKVPTPLFISGSESDLEQYFTDQEEKLQVHQELCERIDTLQQVRFNLPYYKGLVGLCEYHKLNADSSYEEVKRVAEL